MPNENYILLERTELNAAAASVTFASIPQTGYTDLKIVMSGRGNSGAVYADTRIRFNGATNDTNMSSRMLEGSGASASSYTVSWIYAPQDGSTATANTFGNAEIYIPNYTSSNFKSISIDSVLENNATTAYAVLGAGLASITASISSITIINSSGDWLAGSTFSLYGIAAVGTTPVIAPKAIGGNRIDNDGTYWYHTYTSSGSFTPLQGITADILVVAGGGGSRNFQGGGGGAGGLLDFASQALTAISHNVVVGAGGAVNSNGGNSQFAALTLVEGGGCSGGVSTPGGTANFPNGSNGGSGGGGGGGVGPTQNGGIATSGQGSNGGAGNNSAPNYGAGGGGGKSAAGSAGTSSAGGNGGNGTSSYSAWASATSTGVSGAYAGGGGGGSFTGSFNSSGGSGGGGNGGNSATDGTVNTGGGGGCGIGSSGTLGKTGGSGIIIIRYPIAI
jgi:hypothetical protein